MATKLCKKEFKLIMYFLGIGSKDTMRCKLVCKTWRLYFKSIEIMFGADEKEEEKSYIPSLHIQRSQPLMVAVSRTGNKATNTTDSSTNTSPSTSSNLIRSIDVNLMHKRRKRPSDFLKHSLDRAFWRLDQGTLDKMIASGHSPHIQNMKITQIIDDGLLTESEKKYIDNRHKVVHVHKAASYASVAAPPNALTTKQKHKISAAISQPQPLPFQANDRNEFEVQNILASSTKWKPQYPLHLLQNDTSYKRHDAHQQHKKRKRGEITSIDKAQRGPDPDRSAPKRVHKTGLLQRGGAFSRSLTGNKLKQKRNTKRISAQSKSRSKRMRISQKEQQLLSTMFDPDTFESTLLSPQQSMFVESKKKKKRHALSSLYNYNASQPMSQSRSNYNAPFLSPSSYCHSETEEFNLIDRGFDDNNAQLEEIIKQGPVKDISFLPRGRQKKHKLFGISTECKHIWASTDDDVTEEDENEIMDIELKHDDSDCDEEKFIQLLQEDEGMKNIGDTGSSIVGSNLSKSLLLNSSNKRPRLGTDDSLFLHGRRKRGYTTDSAEIDLHYSRQIITPYELRKQHSLLRIIDATRNKMQKTKPSPSLLIGGDNNPQCTAHSALVPAINVHARPRDHSGSHSHSVMNKLMGPLYSREEQSNWNDMKKVDQKYENILKKRRKKRMFINASNGLMLNSNLSATTSEDAVTTTVGTEKSSFWGNLYDWVLGDNLNKVLDPNTTSTTNTYTTTSNGDIDRAGGVLASLLIDVGGVQIKQNLDDIEKKRETETTQISFWRDIVIANWDLLHKTSVVKLFWEREGIPKSCRGQVWYSAVGNKLNIAPKAFENMYKVSGEEVERYLVFMDKAKQRKPSESENSIKSILGGNVISTRTILNYEFAKNDKKILNEAGKTVHFCRGLKRKNSIERDISRLFGSESFEDLTVNSIDKKHKDIASVLMAFCNCRKSIGYIQFMTHLVQILLNYQSPAIAFISLSNMLNAEIFEIYIHCNVSEIRQRIEIFTKMLVYNSSDIARHLQKLSILADTYVMDWCNGLFSAQLPLNIVSRVWDLYFLNGEIIIWKCSVALLIILNENLNIAKKSHHKIVKILQSIKKSLSTHNIILDEEEFVKKIYSIKLPRDVRKWFKKKEYSRKRKGRKRRKKKRKHRQQKHYIRDTLENYQKGKLNKQNRSFKG